MRRRKLNLAALAAAALFLVPTTSASAAPAAEDTAALGSKRLNITMQAQQKTNWCWAAGGNTIATWFGRNYSQNQFCNAAFNRQQGYDCPNNQATLGNVQTGLSWAASDPARTSPAGCATPPCRPRSTPTGPSRPASSGRAAVATCT